MLLEQWKMDSFIIIYIHYILLINLPNLRAVYTRVPLHEPINHTCWAINNAKQVLSVNYIVTDIAITKSIIACYLCRDWLIRSL